MRYLNHPVLMKIYHLYIASTIQANHKKSIYGCPKLSTPDDNRLLNAIATSLHANEYHSTQLHVCTCLQSLAKSFLNKSRVAYHSVRYDFKPASMDSSKEACVDVGEKQQVTVTVPHVQGSGTTHTVYKGNKRQVPKECVLIIDHDSGSFTLERLSNCLQLKKTRIEGSSRAQQGGRPLTPVDHNKPKQSPSKSKATSQRESPSVTPVHMEMDKDPSPIGEISDSSSDSSSDSDSSDSEDNAATAEQNGVRPVPTSSNTTPSSSSRPKFISTLSEDLRLSESGSDSD
ncbi:hypothetical protein ScPMuIL_016270 [Solemya velum]